MNATRPRSMYWATVRAFSVEVKTRVTILNSSQLLYTRKLITKRNANVSVSFFNAIQVVMRAFIKALITRPKLAV